MVLKTSKPISYSTFRGKDPPHPQAQASWLSWVFLAWVMPLVALGNKRQLNAEDLWPLQRQHQAESVSLLFSRNFERTQSIVRSFWLQFSTRFCLTGLSFLLSMLCSLVGPVVLDRVLSSLTTQSEAFSLSRIAYWVIALFVAQIAQALADNFANLNSEVIAIEVTGAVKSLIYRKTMRLDAESRKEKTVGAITTIYTSDTDSMLAAAYLVHRAWLIPLQIAVVSWMLYRVLGVAAFAGIAVIILMLYLNHVVSKRMFALQGAYRNSMGERMKRVTEVFKAISIVKFNAWEDKFMERIDKMRSAELRDLLRMRYMTCLSIVLSWGMPVFISMVSFGVYAVLLRHELTPAIVFTSIALFQLIQMPLRMITQIITILIQSKVALDRISSFLSLPELAPDNVITINHQSEKAFVARNVIISIEKGEFGWDNDNSLLRNVNLQVHSGDFYVIHGTVGCGKSSLCSALLGEMVKRNGQVFVGGSVAYCSQQPWIQNMTVRENILFGLPYDHKKYQKVVDACALTSDLETFPAGDQTEIGERGVNVSGGQKARIALARACYSDASIYILDSPLSAVDAIVQNEIFEKCLLGLLRHKTILLVTHNPEIIASKLITHAITINDVGTLVETHRIENRDFTYKSVVSPMAAYSDGIISFNDESNVEAVALESPESPHSNTSASVKIDKTGQLIDNEDRSEGRVGGHVFAAYYHAVGGFWVTLAILFSQALWQALQIGSDFWLSSWSNDSQTDTKATEYRLGVYTALGLASASMVAFRTLVIMFYGLQAAKNMFNRMTIALMHAPLKFFDTNPIGRILTRYGSDISAVDSGIPFMFGSVLASVFSMGCSVITAAIVIQWKGLLLIPVVYLYIKLVAFYLGSARDIQRLAKTSDAPVLSHLAESVEGRAVVRSFGVRQLRRFQVTNSRRLDENNRVWFARACVQQWFSLRVQLVGSLLLMIITSSLVLLHEELPAAVIGLAFSYGLRISQNLETVVEIFAYLETSMVSPERIQEYINVPQESVFQNPVMDPPANTFWPWTGSIEFQSVCFQYKPNDPLVLTDVSFKVQGGQKIGIVGRTGAGKSSLTMALFRINELASGTITIDGINISSIGLKTLREKLSIIPQNPVLFKGPLRHYLDPFDDFSDEELWESIRQVGLSDRISQEDSKLQCTVEENGENFSVGERQMLCMAQALLRHTRIVVFDEATAAIDHETDEALQKVIRTAFASSTVLTIAHRLDTILDSDKILVLDDGRVVEFSSPKELVVKGSGHFFDLMQEGGYLDKFKAKNGRTNGRAVVSS